jgi:hypothetical protein
MRIFIWISYTKVPDARRTKLDAKDKMCVILGYCEGTKAYRLMSVDTKKIIRSRDVTFCEESTVGPHLEDGQSGRLGDVIVDTSSKSPIVDVGDENGGEKDGELEAPSNSNTKNDAKMMQVENAPSNNQRYPKRVYKPPGEWWKNHIFPPSDDEHAIVAISDGPWTIREALQGEDAVKWEQAKSNKYESLVANGTWKLTPMPRVPIALVASWCFVQREMLPVMWCATRQGLWQRGLHKFKARIFMRCFLP